MVSQFMLILVYQHGWRNHISFKERYVPFMVSSICYSLRPVIPGSPYNHGGSQGRALGLKQWASPSLTLKIPFPILLDWFPWVSSSGLLGLFLFGDVYAALSKSELTYRAGSHILRSVYTTHSVWERNKKKINNDYFEFALIIFALVAVVAVQD